MMFIPDPLKVAPVLMSMLFSSEWLDGEDEDNPGWTNYAVQSEVRHILHGLPEYD
jgi:hypothetical protein